MNETEFWGAIALLDWSCEGDGAAAADPLVAYPAPPAGARLGELAFAPMRAWARKYGADPADYPHDPRPGFQTFDNAAGWS